MKPGVVRLSKALTRMVDRGAEGVELRFKDGSVVVADLVVGADGIRSVGRPSTPNPQTQNLRLVYDSRRWRTDS